eukprot:3342925-Amphidinium_carterae.1
MRRLTLRRSGCDSQQPLLTVRGGASCTLMDCRIISGSLRIEDGATVQLTRTVIMEAPDGGLIGSNFKELRLTESCISNCGGDGMQVAKVEDVHLVDSTFTENKGNGAVLGGRFGSWSVSGCTFLNNQ